MWTDAQLAEALETAKELEQAARAAMATDDLAERDAALTVTRHVTAFRKSLESWIGTRAIRAHLGTAEARMRAGGQRNGG